MRLHDMPERFWIVMKPSPFSTADDILFPCSFERLMSQARGGLNEDEIVGIFADEGEARQAAARLLGDCPVRPRDAVAVEVVVHVMVVPEGEGMTARELAKAAVMAVADAVRQGEAAGFRHGLTGRIRLGTGPTELRNVATARG